MSQFWKVNQEKTEDSWLEVEDPEGWYKAVVKWDGCVHLNRFFNLPFTQGGNDSDYLHVCDLNDFIDRLTELRDLARQHFEKTGDEWPW